MNWCRIIEANGEQHLCVLAPGSEGLALVVSWMVDGRVMSAVLPPEEFDGPDDAQEFLAMLKPENVLMLRSTTEQTIHADDDSHELAAHAIAKAKGLH